MTGLDPFSWTPDEFGERSPRCQRQDYHPSEFRRQMVELARAGRSAEELAREFEPSAQAIRNWVAQADRDEGRRGRTSSSVMSVSGQLETFPAVFRRSAGGEADARYNQFRTHDVLAAAFSAHSGRSGLQR